MHSYIENLKNVCHEICIFTLVMMAFKLFPLWLDSQILAHMLMIDSSNKTAKFIG